MDKLNCTQDNFTAASELCGKNKELSPSIEGTYIAGMVTNSLIFILGVVGNGIVIWITGFRVKKSINTTFFLNLAIADFLFAAMRPFAIVKDVLRSHWPFGLVLCKLSKFVKHLNIYASVFMLTVISIDRCILISCPVWSRNHRTIKMSYVVSLLVWLIAMGFSSPHLVFHDTLPKGDRIKCSYNFSLYKRMSKLDIYIIRFLVGFLIPFIIISVCYLIIGLQLRKKKKVSSSRAIKLIVAIIALFFFCWMPYHLISFLKSTNISKAVLKVGYQVASCLAYANSFINPVLYFFMGYNYRQRFRQSITAAFRNVLIEPSIYFRETTVSKEDRTLSLQMMDVAISMNKQSHL
ncbi:chemerin-like receptor 1 [Latimeria chalumnae]|uniref:chemerin-like receptor 1 n=1 Tax=Latimeria chalumnae TaxID=7897 RepID=UPI0003C18F36|nr:PREDICTED: chemokine-like receptor 1 [Latimeria chalumnae]|eukprot:XP_005995747.1 PREDICTED: chemokine-like receptor 1 [Latimeria chalumnae]